MRAWTLVTSCGLLAACVLVACGHQAAPSSPGSTTTGLLLPGVPTEGSRPPAAALPPAAEPQNAPPPIAAPAGRVLAVGRGAEGIAVDAATRTVAVATRDPDAVVLMDVASGVITTRVPLPGTVRHLQLVGPRGPLLVPVESANALLRIGLPRGVIQPPITTGSAPHDAAAAANGTVFVGNEHGGTVAAVRGDRVVKIFTDSVQPAGVAAVGDTMGVLDVRKNDLTLYDADRLTIVGATAAGAGPTHLVADRHGRMIAADTRGNAVRVFTPLPAPREVAVVAQPGAPYGIAYDATRDRLWVASSGTNEVLGYDMSGAVPVAVQRFSTVRDAYTVAVDAATGRLFVAGAADGVVQVIDPAD